MTLPTLPDKCGFCGLHRDSTKLHVSVGFDWEGNQTSGALCEGCIRVFIINMAHSDREKFDALVEEARNWKPGDP